MKSPFTENQIFVILQAMTASIIIVFSILLLLAYVFDLTAPKTKVPSVILLLLLGWTVKQTTLWFEMELPDVSPVLPILGTFGLILIVLDGALELEFNKSKFIIIRKSFFGALVSMVALSFLIAFAFNYFGNYGIKNSLINAIPFCVISSAIAIPSVKNLSARNKEFVIYESSLSDIFGVLMFNFLVLNETIDGYAVGLFSFQILIITLISLAATLGLSFLLSKIDHHIKFIPIIVLIILIYEVSKVYHLPGLIFILLFGLSIGNLDELKQFKWVERFKPDELNREVKKFHELIIEGAFLIRASFFLLFGYLIDTPELLNYQTLPWAAMIVGGIILFRAIQLRISRLPIFPLLFVAPRGLITILLFLSIESHQTISLVNESLIIQVVIISALLMMFGLMFHRPKKDLVLK